MSLFSQRLKELREEKGLSQSELLQELNNNGINTSPQNISNWEKGREPNYNVLIALANVFSVSTDYLLGISDLRIPLNQVTFYKDIDNSTLNLLINIKDTFTKYNTIYNPTLAGFEVSSKYIQVMTLINKFFEDLNNVLRKDNDNIIDSCLEMDNKINSERIENALYKSLSYDLYNLNSQLAKIFSELNSLISLCTLSKSTSTIFYNFMGDIE